MGYDSHIKYFSFPCLFCEWVFLYFSSKYFAFGETGGKVWMKNRNKGEWKLARDGFIDDFFHQNGLSDHKNNQFLAESLKLFKSAGSLFWKFFLT